MTPAAVIYGQDHLLPIELLFPTWRVTSWETVQSREDLLAARAKQLDRRDEDVAEAMLRLRRHREWNKEYFDSIRNVRHEELEVNDLVLVFDSRRNIDMAAARKLAPRWKGPYRVVEVREGFGTYYLAELDGTRHKRSYPGRLLKRFFRRSNGQGVAEPWTAFENEEEAQPAPPRTFLEVAIPRPDVDPAEFQYFTDEE